MRSACAPALAVCLAFALLAGGCTTAKSSSDSMPSGPSGPAGRIEFSVSPTSVGWAPFEDPRVAFNTYCNANNQTTFGPFVWTLRETGGGTVTVTAFTAKATGASGAVISDLTQLIGLLAVELTGASGSSVRLQPNQSLTGKERFTCQPSQPGAGFPIHWGGSTLVYTVSGTDSNGTPVSSTATLNILPAF